MSRTAIHGYQLEITVVSCWELRDSSTKFHDQDPYVRLEYANTTYRTQICKRQIKEPIFNQKFTFFLSEGCHEIGVNVLNKNTMERDYLIGATRVPLTTVLLNGFHEGWWPLQYENRPAGQIKLVMNKLAVQRNNVMGYNLSVPADLQSPREAAVPYMAYPPSYPITSQPLPSSIPQPILLPPTENRSVSYVRAIPFSPSAPSAPKESFPFDLPPPPPPIVVPSSYTPSSTDLQNHPSPVSPSPYVPPRYEEERVANREGRAVEEERSLRTERSPRTEVEPTMPSLNQTLVQRTPPHPSRPQISANSVRQRKPKNETTAEERSTTAETIKSSSKASSSLSGKARLYVFVFCLFLTLYVKVGCPLPDLPWVRL